MFQEHLNEFNALVSKLAAIGVNMDEEENTILLCSMPHSFDGVIMFLSNTTGLNFDFAVNRLLVEESRKKNSGNSFGDAMIARGRSTNKDSSDSGRNHSKSKVLTEEKGELLELW